MTQASLSDENEDEVRSVTIKGRAIDVMRPHDAQLVLIAREGQMLEKDGIIPARKWTALSRVMNTLESLVVKDEDKEYLIDLTVDRQLHLEDMLPIVKAFSGKAQALKVRRGRPPKRA
jgi:hypothetical protein